MYNLSLIGVGASLFCALIATLLQQSSEEFGKILKYLFITFGIIYLMISFMSGVSYTYYENGTISNLEYGHSLSAGINTTWILIFFFITMMIIYGIYINYLGGMNGRN